MTADIQHGAEARLRAVCGCAAGEASIQGRLVELRRALESDAGSRSDIGDPFRRPVEHAFTLDQRDGTTVLFGGLNSRHDALIRAVLEGRGYRVEQIPTADLRAYQIGREYGNNGQCSPAYFTVGSLVGHLQGLLADGLGRKEIVERYVFFTAGACGPCRFGMYEAEYRLALRNSGFDGFRVMILQQGTNEVVEGAGFAPDIAMFLAVLNSLVIGDLITEMAFQIRPYEVFPGDTERAIADGMRLLEDCLLCKSSVEPAAFWRGLAKGSSTLSAGMTSAACFVDQLRSQHYVEVLGLARDRLDRVRVDRLRVKPIVKITGEFWAQTTDGDGNYRMFSFLERENAEVLVEPVATWVSHLIHSARIRLRDRAGLVPMSLRGWRRPFAIASARLRTQLRVSQLDIAKLLFVREYERMRHAVGGVGRELVNHPTFERIAHRYYNTRAQGGEGYLEVAKNIYYHQKDLCHMVLSLKPFGCMPSSQSDGVQAAVVSHLPDVIYLPIETSGEGEGRAHSRVQMTLCEARGKARTEFARALDQGGYPLSQLRAYMEATPALQKPMYRVPSRAGFAGTGARFVLHLADRMRSEGIAPVPAAVVDGSPARVSHGRHPDRDKRCGLEDSRRSPR